MKKIIYVIIFMISMGVFAQKNKKENTITHKEWSAARPDGHAPISIMGDHMHHKGEFMFSYRLMYMNMSGLKNGNNSISNIQAHNLGYRVTPLTMPMKMHMLGAMYAPSDKVTLTIMANIIENDMDLQMRMPNGMTRKFSTASSGLGDLKLGALYSIFNKNRNALHAQLSLSLPTASINNKDVTPMSNPNMILLPYPMQIGSGTLDGKIALTYLGQTNALSWGSQLSTLVRLGKNKNNYRLGNHYSFNNWFAIRTFNWLSLSARMEALLIDKIAGVNTALNPTMVTTANTANSGGSYLNSGVGFNTYILKGNLQDLRFGFEFAFPLYQNPNGVQLKQKESLTLGVQYSF